MARRGKTGLFEDVVEILGRLPWWVGIGLAVVGYVVLSDIARSPLPTPTAGSPASALVTSGLVRGLASAGQYIVPILGVIGALVSIWRRMKRKALVEEVAQNQTSGTVDGMSWREFEMLVGEGFRLQGYRVEETGGGGADGGVDLVLSKPGRNGSEKFLVQCKQWRAQRVSVDVVRELYGVMAARGAAGGFVVTSGRFTEEAARFAEGRNVHLVDGAKLRGLIHPVKAASKPLPASRAAKTTQVTEQATQGTSVPREERSPTCPVCTKGMVRRTATRGANAGGEFWGCSSYPACRGTRSVS